MDRRLLQFAKMGRGLQRAAINGREVCRESALRGEGNVRSQEKIAPKHAGILVIRAADPITMEQQALQERNEVPCPDLPEHGASVSLRNEGGDRRTAAWLETQRQHNASLVRSQDC